MIIYHLSSSKIKLKKLIIVFSQKREPLNPKKSKSTVKQQKMGRLNELTNYGLNLINFFIYLVSIWIK